MKSKILSSTLLAIGFLVGAGALSAIAGTWTAAPAAGPTNDNADAPINVGYDAQIRQGGLILNGKKNSTTAMTYALDVVNAPIKAEGGLIIETRTTDPSTPETGRMWLRTDL